MNDKAETEHNEVCKAAPRSERDIESGTTARERCRGSVKMNCDLVFAFNEPEDSDFRVIASGVTFYVHRIFLKCRSNLFASILRGGFQECVRGELLIDTFPPADVEAALRWIYTSEVDLTEANFLGVLQVGEYMQLDGLVRQCNDAAKNVVTVDSMLDVFSAVATLADPAIKDACLDVWAQNAPAILQKPQFLNLRVDALATLLSHDAANCTEDALFMRVVEWMRTNLYGEYPREAQPKESDRQPGCGDEDASRTPTVLRLLSHIHLAKVSTQCVAEAVDLANHVRPLAVTLVAGIRHQLTQRTSANDASARPRTGAIVFPDSEPRVIEALSSTDEDSELNVVAMQHGIDLLLASAAPQNEYRVVKTSWDREPTGTLNLTLGNARYLMFPFLYNGRWRLITLCHRDGRLVLYSSYLREKQADDRNSDSRRAYECYAAFRRCLEHAVGTGEQLLSIEWGSPSPLQGHPAEFPNTGTAALDTLARWFNTTPPTRLQIRNRLLGSREPSSGEIETRVHRAVHTVLTGTTNTDPSGDPQAAAAAVIEAAKSADSGGATADGAGRVQIFQETLAQLVRVGLYRCTADGGYAL
jgi:hypothetical protein